MQINQLESAEHASTAQAQLQNNIDTSSSHFDERMDELLNIAEQLVLSKGVFHLTLHFASSQLKCCTFDNPYSFQLYTADQVFADDFMRHFAPLESRLPSRIERDQVRPILNSLRWLRAKKQGSELRNACMHMINGYIGLGFAYDDTRYINFRELILPTLPSNA